MGTIKVPAKTVECCDVCRRTGDSLILEKCVVCGKDYCHICHAIMPGCIHTVDICKKCGDTEAAKDVVNNFVDKLTKVLKARDTALRRAKHRILGEVADTEVRKHMAQI